MAGRTSLYLRGAGLFTILAGGLTLPALTAPAGKSQAAVRPTAAQLAKPRVAPPAPEVPLAVPPPGNRIMSVSEVRPGMKGYGLTVFRGTKIERFDVEVVGLLPKQNLGQPLVLIRLSGGPITQRGAFLIQGMSGSPVYINGKLLGAFAYGNAWPKEPLGMVTPIEDMLEALDPKLPETQAGQLSLSEPLNQAVSGAAAGLGGLLRGPADLPNYLAGGHTFRPLALPVSVSGFSGRHLARLAEVLAPFNMAVMQGPGAMPEPFKAELKPGSAMGGALLTGDIDMTVLGTVTYRDGDKLLGFGHPWMQMGAVQFPLTTMWIHDVFPGFQVSSKIGSAGDICGTITQDRPFGVAARIGPAPAMIPIHCKVVDSGSGRSKTFDMKAANHPLLVGQLLPIAVNQALMTVRPVPGDVVAYVKLKAETDGAGTITRENVFYDPAQIDVTAVRELQELMQILSSNSFRRVPVKNLELEVKFEDKLPTATIERIYLSQDRFEPGDDVEVGVVVRPYRKDPIILKSKVRVPENASNGQAVLLVQGGATRVNLSAITQASPQGLPGVPPPDASLGQVLKRFADRERNNQVVVRVLFPTGAINVNGERVSQLPSTIVDVMRSSKTTGFRFERDEVKKLQDTDYIVQGLQTLQLTIQRKDLLEKPKPAGGARPGAPGTTISLSSPGGGGRSLSADDDAEELSVLRFTVDGQPRVLRLTTPEPDEEDEDEKPKAARPTPAKGAAKGAPKPESVPVGKRDEDKDDKDGKVAGATTPDSKLIGRPAAVWTQTTQADFERGTSLNTAVSTSGEVRLVPGLKLIHEASEQFVWSVAGMDGAVFAGTGNGGQVLKVDAEGKAGVFFRTGELEVHVLARDKAGNLYAGTGPNGKLFRIGRDGKGAELLSMNGTNGGDAANADGGGKFVLSLAAAEDGTLYAGTGPDGKVYRVRPGAGVAEELCTLPTRHVTSLLVTPDGSTLYAGTAEEGAIYRMGTGGPGPPAIVYDTDQAVITGLARDREGNLYAACAPSGEVYRIAPDGTHRVHFNKSKGALYGLIIDQGGNLLTCSANSVMRVEPDGSATILSDRRNGQFTCVAWDEQGRIVAGSANVGSIYRLAATVSGAFESTVHDARAPARWGRIRFTAMVPDGATLGLETRSGNTPEPDATWNAWSKPAPRDGGVFVTSPIARFLQYRVLFQAERGAPALRDVSIYYMPRNQAPKLTLAFPTGGEIVKGAQTLKWSASDPDSDTLTYEVSYSADGGRTWKPAGEKAATSTAAPAPVPGNTRPNRSSADEALKRYREQLDADAGLTPQQRDENFQKAKALVDKYLEDTPAEGGAAPGAPAARPETAAATGSTRQAQLSWDTGDVPDGIYQIRVVATDRASNPGEPLSDAKLSEPFIISNAAPQLFLFGRGITVDPASKTASVVGFGSSRVALKGAEYRLGTGDWTAIEPEDGIWDTSFEHFRFGTAALSPGEQSLEVKLVDAAGNATVSKIKFKGP